MTKAQDAARAAGAINSYTFGRIGSPDDPHVMVNYFAADDGRGGHSARAVVLRYRADGCEVRTEDDPDGAYWRDYGRKTFATYSYGDKAGAMGAAMTWASERWGIPKWIRDPFGGWHPVAVADRANAAIKAAQKTEA